MAIDLSDLNDIDPNSLRAAGRLIQKLIEQGRDRLENCEIDEFLFYKGEITSLRKLKGIFDRR